MKRKHTTLAIPEIENAMAHFKPRFGNDQDIGIIQQYGKIKKLLSDIDASAMRLLQIKKEESKMTARMKEVSQKEKQLLSMLERRVI